MKKTEIISDDIRARMHEIAQKHQTTLAAVLSGDANFRPIVRARDEIAYTLKDEYGLSYPFVGSVLGRDHSSVIQAVRRFAEACGDTAYLPSKYVKLAKASARSGVVLKIA